LGGSVVSKNVSSHKDKKYGTIRSRFAHFLKFLQSHSLKHDQFLSLPQSSQDYVSACYAESLVRGNTIKQQDISLNTIFHYLKDAGIHKRPHPLYPSRLPTYPPLLDSVLLEYKRWQSVPNRRHPVTISMLNSLYQTQKSLHQDSYLSALFDWLVVGMQTGQRKSEWCQDLPNFKKTQKVALSVQSTPLAFIADDFVLSSKPIPSSSNISSDHPPPHFNYLTITWRFQKNGQNGQAVSFSHDYANPHLSVVAAAERILLRAQRLHQPHHLPLAVYAQPKQTTPSYIFHTQVQSSLRAIAKKVYKLTDPSHIQKYSCHSIRVGACVLLHSAGADTLTIKFRLRWRSDSFMEYLRNTPRLASLHTQIISSKNTDVLCL